MSGKKENTSDYLPADGSGSLPPGSAGDIDPAIEFAPDTGHPAGAATVRAASSPMVNHFDSPRRARASSAWARARTSAVVRKTAAAPAGWAVSATSSMAGSMSRWLSLIHISEPTRPY